MERQVKPIKVVHVTTVAQSLQGLLLNQMKCIQSTGCEVAGISSPGKECPGLEAEGVRHIPIPMSRKVTPWLDLVSLVRLYRVMRKERFTIVHTHTPKAGLLGQLAARLAGVPIIVNTIHGYYEHDFMHPLVRRLYLAFEAIAARCSHLILSQNQEDVETAIAMGICGPHKIRHLGNGIDLSLFDRDRVSEEDRWRTREELGIPPDVQVVGFVGRLAGKRKGFLDFLAAGRSVVRRWPHVRFLIIGDADVGKADAVSSAVAGDYGLADRSVFLGARPNGDMPSLYAVMDLLVLPSLFEGIPRVVMEAAAMGIPAVVTDVKGNREAVVHGRTGLHVPLGDTEALADAIVEILLNPERAGYMGEEAYRLAREQFDEQAVFHKVISEYSNILEEKLGEELHVVAPVPAERNGRNGLV